MNEDVVSRPNIIIILADDMGFSDIGCFGSEISTPNIDSLSVNGAVFTQAYNCARCCPSRASLLTGLYPHQAGMGHMVADFGKPSYTGYLNDNSVTIAEVLKQSGYKTALSGKWHLGRRYDLTEPENKMPVGIKGYPTPNQKGFDEFYGTLVGATSYFNPKMLMENESFVEPEGKNYHFTDATTEHAINTIEKFNDGGDPFFLYLSYTAPHWPLQAFEEDIAKYEGSYLKGWSKTRAERYEKLKSLGIIDPDWEISPKDSQAPDWEDIKHKEWEDRRMAVYAAQVEHMDRSIGKVIEKLKERNIYDNTVIMFLSDNGGCAEFLAEDASLPLLKQFDFPTLDGKKMRIGNTPEIIPGPADTFVSYDLPWANVSNTPFRLYKHWVHEGGIA
ncbi:MAG: sulfatase-like hydrolase/transferase, partial [candidate division Zixibacteria bacterium]|nr:sulfatase-like hydrolase/transferase [candidate division Zixibacteria bacterium]